MSHITYNKDGSVILGEWQKGIADSPHLGIADMRNVNVLSSPGAASVNFSTSALTLPPTVSAVAYTTNTATDTFTVSATSGWFNGMAVTLNTVVTSTGISTGRVYWVGNLTATTFKLYTSPSLDSGKLVDITGSNGSGTISSYTFSQPLDKAIDYEGGGSASPSRNYIFILDDTGKVWWVNNTGGTAQNNLVYLGNDTLTGTTGRAIAVYKRYIVVFRTSAVDALATQRIEATPTDLDGATGWTYGFDSISSVPQTRRPVIVGTDDSLFFGNSKRVGAFSENSGSSFDPTSGASYTKEVAALDLPAGDDISALGVLGSKLLVAGVREFIYPWDYVSPSFDDPVTLPDAKATRIVSAGQVAYVFAGNRGRIYETDGSNVALFKKIPDHVSGVFEPYYTWNDAIAWKNQLYFSFTATQNDGTTLTSTGGVWAIDFTTGALRHAHQLSYGSYAGSVPVILPNVISDNPAGSGIYAGWVNSGTYGVDVSSSTPYQNYEARIDSGLIPVGTFINKYTPSNFEHKLAKMLVSGEAVRISYRINLTDSFTTIYTATTAGLVSEESDTNFENAEWVQLRIELSSTSTNPSYVPLTNILMN
jgi:hypothetical protein